MDFAPWAILRKVFTLPRIWPGAIVVQDCAKATEDGVMVPKGVTLATLYGIWFTKMSRQQFCVPIPRKIKICQTR